MSSLRNLSGDRPIAMPPPVARIATQDEGYELRLRGPARGDAPAPGWPGRRQVPVSCEGSAPDEGATGREQPPEASPSTDTVGRRSVEPYPLFLPVLASESPSPRQVP